MGRNDQGRNDQGRTGLGAKRLVTAHLSDNFDSVFPRFPRPGDNKLKLPVAIIKAQKASFKSDIRKMAAVTFKDNYVMSLDI